MIYLKQNEIFSLFSAIKYKYVKETTYNYISTPRPCHNFLFMLEGQGEIHTKNGTIFLNPGDILFIPKGTTYLSIWKTNPTVIFHSIHFNFHPNFDPFFNKNIPIQLLNAVQFDEVYQQVKRIEKYQYQRNQNSFFAVAAFFDICGTILQNLIYETSNKDFKQIQPALDFLQKNHTEKCSVENLASLCFLSASRFYYLFKELTGETPINYKNRLTLQAAAQTLLLDKNVSIEEISIIYGFESAVYFRRLFKKFTGKTPTQYRKEENLL
jgi:AraC-like DNA-binding protein